MGVSCERGTPVCGDRYLPTGEKFYVGGFLPAGEVSSYAGTYRVRKGACLRLAEPPLFDSRLIGGSYLARFVTVRYKTCAVQ